MTVRLRGDRFMVDVRHNGRRYRMSVPKDKNTRRGAAQFEREVLLDLEAGLDPTEEEARAQTFGEFATEYMDTHAKLHNKPSTLKSKQSLLDNHLVDFFGSRMLSEIKVKDVDKFKSKLASKGLNPKTVNNAVGLLRKILNMAVAWGDLDSVPRLEPVRAPAPEFDFFTFEEADRLVAATEPEHKCMVITALHTGMRLGELLALRWSDVSDERIRVAQNVVVGVVGTPKGNRSREVPLSKTAARCLEDHPHLSEFVFCLPDGRMASQHHARYPLRRACKRAGLRRVGWHVLRHTFASHLVMRGVSLKAVQELLGHATIDMTMRYAHLSPDVARDAVARLDA